MRNLVAILAVAFICVLTGVIGVAEGQTPERFEDHHLIASDGAESDFFGHSLSVSGDVAIIGAYADDTTSGADAGSAYIYRLSGSTWVEETHLFASDGKGMDNFGFSVSVSGNLAIVGANRDDTLGGADSGSAYIFRFNGMTWVEEAHLFASDGRGYTPPADNKGGDTFGISVSISDSPGNEIAIVGARWDYTEGGTNAGSAYIYRFDGTNWVEEAHLSASDGASSDWFGTSVSISGTHGSEVAIVGADRDDTTAGTDAGSAYIYRYDGTNWMEEIHVFASDWEAENLSGGDSPLFTPDKRVATLPDAKPHFIHSEGPENALTGGKFGVSVSVSSKVALVGVHFDKKETGGRSGAVYVYRFNGTNWKEETRLFASDVESGDRFGKSVCVSGAPGLEVAIVGSWLDRAAGVFNAGSAYVYFFNGSTWEEEAHLFASDGSKNAQFGHSVSVSGHIAFVGARCDKTEGGALAGSAYFFDLQRNGRKQQDKK